MSYSIIKDENETEQILVFVPELIKKEKSIFAMDLDWTILEASKSFFSDINDYHLLPNRKEILNNISKNYQIVIFTSLISKNINFIIKKIERFFYLIGMKFVVMCSLTQISKKPNKYLFDCYKKFINNKVVPKLSFYCGDSIGRIEDYSDMDIKFSKNLGMKFYSPEEIFGKIELYPKENIELVLIMGMPGSGNKKISNKFKNYIKINYNDMKNEDLKKIKNILDKKSVVIYNITPNKETRKKFTTIKNVEKRLIYVSKDGRHMNQNKKNPKTLNDYHCYFNNFDYPNKDEGFELIIYWQKDN